MTAPTDGERALAWLCEAAVPQVGTTAAASAVAAVLVDLTHATDRAEQAESDLTALHDYVDALEHELRGLRAEVAA